MIGRRAALATGLAVLLLGPGARASIPLELRFDGRPFAPYVFRFRTA